MDSPVNERVTAAVALKNKYAAFCSDDEGGDASEIVTKPAPMKKAEKPSAKKVSQQPKTSTASTSASKNLSKPEKSQTATTGQREGGTTRGRGRGNGREAGGATTRDHRREGGRTENERQNDGNRRRPPHPRPAQQQQTGEIGEGDEKTNTDRKPVRGDRGIRRPRGNDRGGARGSNRGDRTGVHDAPKKDGHGKGNWGTEQDELQGETEPIGETTTTSGEKAAQEDNADKNDSGVEMEKEEEKPIGMTYKEWKEKNKPVEPESFNVRKPNDDKKLNLAPMKKTEDENKENGEEFVVLRREPREKHIDISFNFAATTNDASSSGGNRGNRDGFRGRKPRGGGSGIERGTKGENRNAAYNRGSTAADKNQFNLVNDHFPALGGH